MQHKNYCIKVIYGSFCKTTKTCKPTDLFLKNTHTCIKRDWMCFFSSFYASKHKRLQLNSPNKECWDLIKSTPSFVLTMPLASHTAEPHSAITFLSIYTPFDTATTWFLPRVLKSCWRSSSRPDTRWCSPPRASSGLTDTWRTNTPMSGKATGSWALGVRPPVLSVTQLGQPIWLHFFTWCHFFPIICFFRKCLLPVCVVLLEIK